MSAGDALALAIFDVDGTLVDSQDVIVAAMSGAFDGADAPAPSRDAIKRIVGLELYEAVRRLAPDAPEPEIKRIGDRYKNAFIAARASGGGESESPLYPGAREALLRLSAAESLLLGVATGKARRGLDHFLQSQELAHLFVTTQTCTEAPGKPNPTMIENCLAQSGAPRGRAVMIGDTTFDMEMARNAGVAAIGVAWGYHAPEELRSAGAQILIERFDDLDTAIVEAIGPVAGLIG